MKSNKTIISFLLVIFFIFSSFSVFAENSKDVYVIPIKGEINKATYQFIKKNVDMIIDKEPMAIVFEIDTYGGLVKSAEDIKNLIMNLEIPTIAFVNTKAESAGVLITIACDKIVMAEGATIGSAETIPNTEKILSWWVETLKATAQQRGRDPQLVAAMADKDIEIDDIVAKGKLLNLSYKRAEQLGFIDLVSNEYDNFLDKLNISYNNIIKIETNARVKLANMLTNPYISGILIFIGFIGLLIEVFTPGFGAGGTISFISFALFFGGSILAGNTGWGVLILFIAGLALLLIEAAIPGFGVPGIGGIALFVVSIVLASDNIEIGILSVGISIILTIVIAILLLKYGYKSPYLDRIILSSKQENKSGYVSIASRENYLNKEGIAITSLRPAGTIEIDGDRVDAVTEGGYIDKGSKVKVLKVEGPRVVVRKI
ncbi:NfeD family protein [Thermohalobacter berrensis]|uniref:Nodulation efficiency protein D (NfeD) n=1 Tax=Thermohalobacter berrensis TaxID=99594 RepID=A0A419TB77_9FIRM|nr:NfeD family protein [Thermohalobacter berrensis]RKD34736.1 Nodulation efficiency protein D (NfeD) [Thermohalobacter berrensis]